MHPLGQNSLLQWRALSLFESAGFDCQSPKHRVPDGFGGLSAHSRFFRMFMYPKAEDALFPDDELIWVNAFRGSSR